MLAPRPDAPRPSIVLAPAGAPGMGRVAEALDGRFAVERLDARDLSPRLAATAPEVLVLAGSEALALCRAARAERPLLSLPVLVVGAPLGEALAAGASDAVGPDVGSDELALRVASLARAQKAHEDALAALAVESAQRLAEAARERQRAEEANRIKDEFFANLSHELRTPLTSILGWAHILRTRAVPEEKRARALESVERNASALARLVEDLLDVSRIIAHGLSLSLGPVDLGAVVEAEVEAVRPLAEQRGLVLSSAVDPAAAAITGDAERLRQVVANLLSNAVKFTPTGGTITVQLDREGSRARLTVTDTGRGIPPDFLPFVFDRFRQADGGPTRAHGGLGLGLAIARHLVTLHQGTIEVESAGLGQGAAFTVRIPLGGSRVTPPTGAAVVSRFPDLRGVLVVVAGDDGETRALVASTLEPCGTSVVGLPGDARAAEALWRGWPQVLVVDLGAAAGPPAILRELRELSPDRGQRVGAVAIMDRGRPAEGRARAVRAGFDVLVETPLDPAELIGAVASLCRRV